MANRETILDRTRVRVAARTSPKANDAELRNGIPVFLSQLVDALTLAEASGEIDHQALGASAARHGQDLLRMGLTIAQVVHDYGDVCQTVTALAIEQKAPIPWEEFQTLNLCLDNAIAGAVTEYARQRERTIAEEGTQRLGILAHEMRNLVAMATLSFDSIKTGRVAPGGSTGLLHGRSLLGLSTLIDRSLADVRLDAGIEHRESISVAAFLEEIEVGALIEAQSRSLVFESVPVEIGLTIEGDRQILAAAISNLLHNALKFTQKHGTPQGRVRLTTRETEHRVLFEVEDECGGLPAGAVEELFRPYAQRGADRRGAGLGLTICGKAARAHGGEVRVRDLPGHGCVFTLELPKIQPPRAALVGEHGAWSAAGLPPLA